jgi:hypothetical protein
MKRLILLVTLVVFIYTLTIVFSAPSITFDNEQYITAIFRYYSKNNTYSSNLATLSSFQLFSNDARPGDMIYFGYGSPTYYVSAIPWHDIFFSISSPLQGTGIKLVWEYWNDSAKAWMPIPNLVDDTNGFTQSGWVRFPIPPYWYYGGWFHVYSIRGVSSLWVRVRLVNGTVTNGGYVNQRVKIHDYTLTIRDYPSINFTYIYNVVKQNGWNIMINPNNNTYIIFSNIKFVNSTLYSSKEIIQIGTIERPMTIQADRYSKIYFGRLASNGVGIDGSEIYLYTKSMEPYLPLGNFYFYGSRFTRYGGGFASPMFPYNVLIIDSQLVSDTMFYFPQGSVGTLTRVLYSVPHYIYIYSGGISINQLILPSNALGVLVGAGSPAVVSNVVFSPGQYLSRYYDAWVDLIDCVISPSQILNNFPQNRDVWVRKRYSFNLKLIDNNGNPVSGATVKLYDTYGNLVFSLTTNSTGQIPTQYVMTYITWWNKSENWTIRHEKNYNPFTLVISHPSYPPVIMKWNIEQKVDLLLPIDPLDPAELYVNTTRNIYLPKDVVIINAYVLYENAKQTGLTINVTVFKPDGSKSPLIQLRDDGQFPDTVANDGLYAGLFTDTSMTGIYLVNASTIYLSGLLRANWTFLVDNTADLVLKVNSSLSAQISSVNNTLSTRISQLSSQISSVNNSLYTKIVDVNNTLYLKINDLSLKLTSVNGTLYNTIINMNRTLYVKLSDVNNSLYALITAVNNSLYLKISEISGISFDTTSLENKITSVNNTLYTKLERVNATLYGKIIQVNNSLYLKVNDVLLRLNSVNGSLYSAISSVNSTIHLKLTQEESTHEDILNKLKNINLTLYGKLEAVNNTLVLRIEKVSGQILSVNNTVTSSTSTVTSKLSEIKDMLSKINVDFTPVLNKIDQATSTILDAIGKVSSQIKQLQDALQKNQMTLPSWVFWLIVAQVFIIGAIFLVVKRQPLAQFTPYLQPSEKHRVFNIVFAIVFLVFAYLLLNSFSALLPIPIPLAFGIVTLFTLIALYLGVKRTLALAILLGLIVYLAWTQHIEISLPSPPNPPSSPSEPSIPSMPSIPLPIISLATVFIIFTIIYIILWRRKKQQEVMLW